MCSSDLIASQYARIDEWLAEHPGWDEAGVAAFVDSSGFGGMASALAFDAGSTSGLRFAATPGFMQLPGLALQRLRGLSEGFRALL